MQKDTTGRRGGQIKDKTGYVQGRLTVISRAADRNGNVYWSCLCICGNTTELAANALRPTGKTQSCGCLRYEAVGKRLWKGYGDISASYWAGIVRNSKVREHELNLTIEEAWQIFLNQHRLCALSGQKLFFTSRARGDGGEAGNASLDRIDSSIGYQFGNVQWVHKTINLMKNTISNEEFVEMCKMIARHND